MTDAAKKRERTIEAVRRGSASIPAIRAWMKDLLDRHAESASPVIDRGLARVPDCFPEDVLRRTRVAIVTRIPFPPLSQAFGLPELVDLEHLSFSGITWGDMIFVHASVTSEATYFHELVHAVQWHALGEEDYILTCGVGLVECGYAQSPFEAFTYDLQRQFERGMPMPDLMATITHHAIQTRAWAMDFYQRIGGPTD